MPFSNINKIKLHYQIEGSGPPLLLLAGMASDMMSWGPLLPELSHHFRLITLDNRCTGQTTPMPVATSRELMTNDVIALLDELRLNEVAILGHSMGAMLGWNIAATAPTRVTRLIAASAPPQTIASRVELFRTMARVRTQCNEGDWFRLLFQFLFSDNFFTDTKRVDDAVQASTTYPHKQSVAALQLQAEALASFSIAPDVQAVSCPVLALTGANDALFTPAALQHVYQQMPGVQTAIVDDAAHALHWENPEAVIEHVKAFLLTDR